MGFNYVAYFIVHSFLSLAHLHDINSSAASPRRHIVSTTRISTQQLQFPLKTFPLLWIKVASICFSFYW